MYLYSFHKLFTLPHLLYYKQLSYKFANIFKKKEYDKYHILPFLIKSFNISRIKRQFFRCPQICK